MRGKLETGLLATVLVQLVQWPFFIGTEVPGGIRFLLFHAALVGALLVPLAALRRAGASTRRVGMAYAALPVCLALWPESLDGGLTSLVAVAALLGATGAVAVAERLRFLGEPHPVPLAGAGAAVGAALMGIRHGSAGGGMLALAALLALGLTALAWRPPTGRAARLAWIAGFVPALLIAPGVQSWQPEAPPPGVASDAPPVVVVVLDAVRADHLRLYGYERDTMPNLEALDREEGFSSRRSLANAALSLPTHASIFTGLYPGRHGAHLPFLEDPSPPQTNLYPLPREDGPATLAELLSEAGYWTLGLSGNYTHLQPAMGLDRGFHVYRADRSFGADVRRRTPWCMATALAWHLAGRDRTGPCQPFQQDVPYRDAAAITDEALAALDAAGERSFFLFLNYFDAHNPFLPPSEFAGTYPGELPWDHARRLDDVVRDAGEAELTAAERAHLAAAYDAELRYLDQELGRLLRGLRTHPRWEELLLIVTSDHGMSLGEHGLVGHESHLLDPMVQVPLVIKPGARGPERPRGGVDTGLRQSVDLFPLVLEAAGVPPVPGIDGVDWQDGRSTALAWLFVDGKLARRDPLLFARELRMAERGGLKLIESSRGERWAFELEGRALEPEPVSIAADRLAGHLAALGDWPRFDPSRDRGPEAGADVMERLRSLGYVE